jgi:hypothetical protein
MGANAKTSGKWASRETWKCTLINNKTRGRVPFFGHTAWAVQQDAKSYLKANKIKEDEYRLTEPVEVFKKGMAWDTAVSF